MEESSINKSAVEFHEEGVTWLRLAAATGDDVIAKRICLRHAIKHLTDAMVSFHGTNQEAKALRNLAITYRMLAKLTSGCRSTSGLADAGRSYVMALKYYARFSEIKGHVTAYDDEFGRCLDEALTFCELPPPEDAISTIEWYLDVIPKKENTFRFLCLMKMSDILDFEARKNEEMTTAGHEKHKVKEEVTSVSVRLSEDLLSEQQLEFLATEPTPKELLLALKHFQHPRHPAHLIQDPCQLSPLSCLIELGRAKRYYSLKCVRDWLNMEHQGMCGTLKSAIEREFTKYKTSPYAIHCLLDIQSIHKHSAVQFLSTLHASYSIFTPYTPKFSLPPEELKSPAKIRIVLNTATVCTRNDRDSETEKHSDLKEILNLMIAIIEEAKCDFEDTMKAGKQFSSSLEMLRVFATRWRPFEDILPPSESMSNDLDQLLLLRTAHRLATTHDKQDFILVLDRRIAHFETKVMANVCVTQLLKKYIVDPIRALSLLYHAYPPTSGHDLIQGEQQLRQLTTNKIKRQIHYALRSYTAHASDVTSGTEWKNVCRELRHALMVIREQLT